MADQIHMTDINSQLKRGRSYEHPQFAGLEPALGSQAQFARQAAVMRGNGLVAEAIGG